MNVTAYQRADCVAYSALKGKLTEFQLFDVRAMEAKACGYVWGWEDAKGDRIREFVASWDFSILYAQAWARHYLGEAKSVPSVQDAWQAWLSGEHI